MRKRPSGEVGVSSASSSKATSLAFHKHPVLKGWNEVVAPQLGVGPNPATTASFKPRIPVLVAPQEPYVLVEPIDFAPYTTYAPSELELRSQVVPPPKLGDIWTLDADKVEDALASGETSVDYDFLPDYVQMLLDLTAEEQRGVISNPAKNWAAYVKTHQLSREEERVLADYDSVLLDLKRNGDVDFLADPTYPALSSVFPHYKDDDIKAPAENMEQGEPSKESGESMKADEESAIINEPSESGQDTESHPDHPEWTCVKKTPIAVRKCDAAHYLGSVFFEDEQPPEPARLVPHGVLRVLADASLTTGTAGCLYLPASSKKSDTLKLHRNYQLDVVEERENDLLAISTIPLEGEYAVIVVPIRESYRVKRRAPATLDAAAKEDEELMEELKLRPDVEIVAPSMPHLSVKH